MKEKLTTNPNQRT